MRKALLMLTLVLAATTPMSSQSLAQQLLEISNDLSEISSAFDREFQTLETQLLTLRQESTQHSQQLDDLGPRVETSEESLIALRSSHTDYRTYVQGALTAQAARINRLNRELWIYRIGGGALALTVGYLAVRQALAPP